MVCDLRLIGLCLTRPPVESGAALFGFPDFLTALALLILAFNTTDPLYRFRIEVAPIPLRRMAFFSSIVVGACTLLIDIWFAERWPAVPWGVKQTTIQAILGGIFLTIILGWLWFAFLRRPTFDRFNCKRFYEAILWRMIRGSDAELAAIAGEIASLADVLIDKTALTGTGERRRQNQTPTKPGVAEYAHDTLLLLGHRKFCRVVVWSASDTAVAFMKSAIRHEKYDIPLGQFAQNLTVEALLNSDSPIYHEGQYSLMSVFRQMRPFSLSVYGNYRLVAGIGEVISSPFDLDWEIFRDMSGRQWNAYSQLVLITFQAYLEQGHFGQHSSLLARAFDHIGSAGNDIYQLDGAVTVTGAASGEKLSASAGFARDALSALGEVEDVNWIKIRTSILSDPAYYGDITNCVVEMLYQIILHASSIKGPPDLAWGVHYNMVWTKIFVYGPAKGAERIVLFKLRRRLFDEIKQMEKFPNFEGARILGICLNIFGTSEEVIRSSRSNDSPLRRAVVGWARKNYLALVEANPRVAEACIIGSISFDPAQERLAKTFNQGLRLEAPKYYLPLNGVAKPDPVRRGFFGNLFGRLQA